MSIGLLIMIFLFLLFIYLLVAPVIIEIDSRTGLFKICFHRLVSAGLLLNETSLFIIIKVFFGETKIDLLKPKENKINSKKKGKDKGISNRRKPSIITVMKKVSGIIKSFEVKKCIISMDTGEMALNGMLYPWLYLLNRKSRNTIMVNFIGETIVILKIENSIGKMAWAYIRS